MNDFSFVCVLNLGFHDLFWTESFFNSLTLPTFSNLCFSFRRQWSKLRCFITTQMLFRALFVTHPISLSSWWHHKGLVFYKVFIYRSFEKWAKHLKSRADLTSGEFSDGEDILLAEWIWYSVSLHVIRNIQNDFRYCLKCVICHHI